ncbi:hypothetical protein WISP_141718 [Willisornis vidua]|uniref:Uncharacterized protein n=1 Tax=Willisornis vidua TaxID=1566151 RepID=A0ABQ9CRJ4_9PASS|nr:hypothetical protein WISP_141718 [Willisornis vidua]
MVVLLHTSSSPWRGGKADMNIAVGTVAQSGHQELESPWHQAETHTQEVLNISDEESDPDALQITITFAVGPITYAIGVAHKEVPSD